MTDTKPTIQLIDPNMFGDFSQFERDATKHMQSIDKFKCRYGKKCPNFDKGCPLSHY